jgi:hypothetical protein
MRIRHAKRRDLGSIRMWRIGETLKKGVLFNFLQNRVDRSPEVDDISSSPFSAATFLSTGPPTKTECLRKGFLMRHVVHAPRFYVPRCVGSFAA